ncbi:biopolymer transporter ExbD [Nodosilinea sp. LEGE 07298]|jgi:biopolymer transport protein ExbD|uniref:ExbD/TolR family protein n=1 Tax=Nodosilinea sp. LEGE 07298 TaxID=2777970 RepID=UPI001882DE2F|nr:biopolymer transporter ExbD [Nodosilinea sp. LEGE 07298]MBE9108033.1 biopolymer transporter ExbD [Nodosilinea sp. LEGE 07298]
MRSRRRRQVNSQVPEVNLVPMMDVLMTVLTFFIIISMSLTGQQLLNVRLPQSVSGNEVEEPQVMQIDALVVGLDKDGNLVLENEPITFNQLSQRVRTYFAQNPNGKLVLKADRELTYSEVSGLLTDLRAIGGNRVSLAVE